MGELAINDAFDNMMQAVESGDSAGLMMLSGQAEDDTPKQGLSRLNINYDTETDEGVTLKKGAWKVYKDGEYIYADEVKFRPLVRTYEWSTWDAEENKFACRSVQAPSLNNRFPDTSGGDKCGRLTKSEEESLGQDHPMVLASRAATCNQVFYALITMEGKTADGREVKLEDYPIVTYFKRSGFRPAREAIEKLTVKKKLMNETVFTLSTSRKKQGSVTYFVPVFTETESKAIDKESMEVMKTFFETIKASNNAVMEQYREALKARETEEEVDLSADFA